MDSPHAVEQAIRDKVAEDFPENSHDSQVKGPDFLQLVKNTYRVLLGRGMMACYVYFMDKETAIYFRSRVRRRLKRCFTQHHSSFIYSPAYLSIMCFVTAFSDLSCFIG
ncbi:DUF2075 domain-containing protein [Sphingobacterium sp. DN00404]|uniref:DUF2075 domain-containing protein n=1 Tax=Sphingobacterium micropteri TaxID=2763501 RepID=A0ABR7YUE7_9SPHI|nr:DUF2075 domain-containing protein [Sphingobacterium micropteri]